MERICVFVASTDQTFSPKKMMNGVLGHGSALYWAGDNLGKWDEFWYESCPWCRIGSSSCCPAFQCAIIVLRTPHSRLNNNQVYDVLNTQFV